jgi:hypothetical protein
MDLLERYRFERFETAVLRREIQKDIWPAPISSYPQPSACNTVSIAWASGYPEK